MKSERKKNQEKAQEYTCDLDAFVITEEDMEAIARAGHTQIKSVSDSQFRIILDWQ